jgi:hypothetical protein
MGTESAQISTEITKTRGHVAVLAPIALQTDFGIGLTRVNNYTTRHSDVNVPLEPLV